jgi:putative NIF3 family GTP cyclohydrolase 1 type 2
MELAPIVAELDALFRVDRVARDDWAGPFRHAYGEADGWRAAFEPAFLERWAGLAVRGGDVVERVVTCVFPGDRLVEQLEPRTLVFAEHPLDYGDREGFAAVDHAALRERGSSLYVVHAPLAQHPELGPSQLVAEGLGLRDVEQLFPLDPALPGGIASIGDSTLDVDALAERLRATLGPAIPVQVLSHGDGLAGRVAVVAGNGARADVLQAALERGCRTYVTGNAATRTVVSRVQERVAAFRELADAARVALVDVTHYGSERPAQLAMVDWFRRRGLTAWFAETGPR